MRTMLLIALAFSATTSLAYAAADPTDGAAVTRRKIEMESARPTSPATSALKYAAFTPSRAPGIAQTSLTSRFAKRGDAFGDAGLLCGLQPHPDTAGAAAAFGHDPDGKFIGAKLRLSF